MHMPELMALALVLSIVLESLTFALLSPFPSMQERPDAAKAGDGDDSAPKAPWRRGVQFAVSFGLAFLFCYFAGSDSEGKDGPFVLFGQLKPNVPLSESWDMFLTPLLLAAGSDRISDLRKKLGSGKSGAKAGTSPKSKDVEIEGEVELKDVTPPRGNPTPEEPEKGVAAGLG